MASVKNDILGSRWELLWKPLEPTSVLREAQAVHTQQTVYKTKWTLNFQIMDPHKTDKGMLWRGT